MLNNLLEVSHALAVFRPGEVVRDIGVESL
jgi:hypothetical protein